MSVARYLASSAWRGRASGQGTHGSQSTSLMLCGKQRSARLAGKSLGNSQIKDMVPDSTKVSWSKLVGLSKEQNNSKNVSHDRSLLEC